MIDVCPTTLTRIGVGKFILQEAIRQINQESLTDLIAPGNPSWSYLENFGRKSSSLATAKIAEGDFHVNRCGIRVDGRRDTQKETIHCTAHVCDNCCTVTYLNRCGAKNAAIIYVHCPKRLIKTKLVPFANDSLKLALG